jgi:hypothetical protein
MEILKKLGFAKEAKTTEDAKMSCKKCNAEFSCSEAENNHYICPACAEYFRMSAVARIEATADVNTFEELPTPEQFAQLQKVQTLDTAGNTGNITFAPPPGAIVYGDGFTNAPASGETWLYSITEVAANTFWVKSVKMEVAQ